MDIPKEIKRIIEKLEEKGFEAFVVGGCVRDYLRKVDPNDWDITTNAKPEEIVKAMEGLGLETFYENEFFTVAVVLEDKEIVEITTYRLETKYSDKRHPDEVRPAKTLEEDLARRDFTINAMALGSDFKKVIDPFSGQVDLKQKLIRAVNDPSVRFSEDALRVMRAVRLSTTLEFDIEPLTEKAIRDNSQLLESISQERIRDELTKIVMNKNAAKGIDLLRELNLLKYIIPELEEGYEVKQNKHHIYDCYTHNLLALEFSAEKDFSLIIRLASLLHDIAKPRTKRGEGPDSTFYGHEVVGAKMAEKILERLKFPKKDIARIVNLIRHHLFYYNVGEVTDSSIRRLVKEVGPENMEDLLSLRMADRIGSGVPKAEPYKLRHLRYAIEKVSKDPISPKMLVFKGNDVMKLLGIEPGPKVGYILNILMGEVLKDPSLNKKEVLSERTKELGKMNEKELLQMAEKAETEKEKIEVKNDQMTKQKYWVT